jgi:hypothetical protein
VYAAGNDLWVADTGNNRVLVFSSFGAASGFCARPRATGLNYTAPNILEGRELFLFSGFDTTTNLANGGGVVIDTDPIPRTYTLPIRITTVSWVTATLGACDRR